MEQIKEAKINKIMDWSYNMNENVFRIRIIGLNNHFDNLEIKF